MKTSQDGSGGILSLCAPAEADSKGQSRGHTHLQSRLRDELLRCTPFSLLGERPRAAPPCRSSGGGDKGESTLHDHYVSLKRLRRSCNLMARIVWACNSNVRLVESGAIEEPGVRPHLCRLARGSSSPPVSAVRGTKSRSPDEAPLRTAAAGAGAAAGAAAVPGSTWVSGGGSVAGTEV